MNSSYCNCKVVNHKKNAKQLFSQEKRISSTLYFSTWYPYFIHPLHTIIKINIAYTQNNTTKCKKCYAILKKRLGVKASLRWAYLLRSEFQRVILTLRPLLSNCCYSSPLVNGMFLYHIEKNQYVKQFESKLFPCHIFSIKSKMRNLNEKLFTKWVKVFKSARSIICGRKPLKKLK